MNVAKVYRSITALVADYRSRLSNFDDDQFMLSPPQGGWSYSEVYSHIFDASLLSLMAAYKAAKGDGKREKTAFVVEVILFFGGLPPGKRYVVPEQLAGRVKKINISAAEQLITDFELQLAKIYPYVHDIDPKMKVKHPRLGYLNAQQWLRLIEIHLRHHLKQIKRIEKSLHA